MVGLRFSSFGAATMPLSKIIIDKDLDMGQYGIKGSYNPHEWATEVLDWGDVAPHEEVLPNGGDREYDSPAFPVLTATRGEYVTIRVTNIGSTRLTVCTVLINDIPVYAHGELPRDASTEFTGVINADDVVSIDARTTAGYTTTLSVLGIFSGTLGGAKTFDLTGKWLALGIDMKGLAATIKIQGVEIPYSDYPLYFPIAPNELTIPGDWSPSQERPVIKRYV